MKENLDHIRSQIAKAADRIGKKSEEITLIAVSKTYPIAAIEEAIGHGCRDFGENKVQELLQKMPAIGSPVQWHLIGHLQTNKVKYVVGEVALIHSVDSIKLLNEIQKQSVKKDVKTAILLEVNVAEETSKHGFTIEEAKKVAASIGELSHIYLKGLMTVAPYVSDPEENGEIFRAMHDLSVDIQNQNINNIDMTILSMGMSNDYEVAIEEGANMVRIGTALFGQRDYSHI